MEEQWIADAISAVNSGAFIVIVAVLGALVAVLGRRLFLYRRAGWTVPLLLKRNLILFGGLGGLVSEAIVLRAVFPEAFTGDTLLRLAFIIHYDVVVIALFLYYLKVEALDVEDPD